MPPLRRPAADRALSYQQGRGVTACRSIPICGPCGKDEKLRGNLNVLPKGHRVGGLSPAQLLAGSPIEEIEERRTRIMSQMKPPLLDVANGAVIGEDGVRVR